MLRIDDLTYRLGGRVLLNQASATVSRGQRVGLVGVNGAGKTTLLRLIAGAVQPDGGTIEVPSRWHIGLVAQEAPDGDTSLIDTVLAADAERTALVAEAEDASDPARIAEIHARLADIDGYSAPARAASILQGLGFDEDAQARPCREYSGGMRMRVALAATLFTRPDVMLLDEPTNHLDLESTIWLEGHLKSSQATIVLVSHDRHLLNRVANATLHLDNGTLTLYAGGYDDFERARRLKLEQQAAARVKQEAQRRHMQAFVDRFRYKATKARQAQSRLKALAKMEPIAAVIEDRAVPFAFPDPGPLAPPLITLDNVSVGYNGRAVLRDLSLRLDQDDRIALLGANGNGKSTLAKLLVGRLSPLAGEVGRSSKLRVGYFAQHQTEELDPQRTGLAQARAWMPKATEEQARRHLGAFGFPQARAETRIADMSGGEKARLLFALMSRDAPHLLVLDEPTNHLDVDSRQALVESLNTFDGAVILITHDPHLVELVADRLWLVADGRCRPFDGDLDDYRSLIGRRRRNDGAETAREAPSSQRVDRTNRKDQRRTAAQARAALAPLRRKAAQAEDKLAKLEAERRALQAKLADPALYEGAPDRITALQIALNDVETRLRATEAEWLEAQEALEAAAVA